MELYGNKVGHTEGTEADQSVVAGEYVVCTLIAEFTIQVERKVDALLQETESSTYSSSNTLHKDRITRSLQRGEDPQFDQLLSSLGCVAEHCLPSLLTTLFKWYEHQLPNTKRNFAKDAASEGKQHKTSTKSKSDSAQIQCDARTKHRETAVQFVFCLVLIEVLHQLPVHPLPDWQIRSILTYAFNSFYDAPQQKNSDSAHARIVADLYAEVIGVLAQSKFQAVRNKFMYELLKERDKEASTDTILAFIVGMKFFRVRMYPVEDFEASFRFLQELANYSLDVKNREIKHALAGLFVEILVPVAAAVKTEVNVPVLRDFVDSLYPTSLELSKRQKNKLAMYPLVTCLLCVSQKQFFLNNWHIFLDNCLSTLKSRDQKLSRVALESLYRLLWVYMVRIKCESNIATQSRLQSIVKSLFPVGSRNVVPKDTPLNIFVKIIQFIAQERLDFAMKEIVLDLLSISLSGSRSSKQSTIHPERMNIGLRAFLVITDSLQQKDGAPPMPSTVGVMPSGNTLRVKKTFLNKTLTEDEARTIGVSHYHKHVQKALDGILQSLDMQVGQRMMMTNSQFSSKDPQDLLTGEHKPKIELFRTCVAAIPRLMPTGMSHSDLLEMLSRLTVHVDEELRSRAFSALQSFAVDFPTLREEVVATFLSFVLKQVSDVHNVLLDGSLKMLVSLINAWKNNASNAGSTNTARWLTNAVRLLPVKEYRMPCQMWERRKEGDRRKTMRKSWLGVSQKRWWSKERRQLVYSSIAQDVRDKRKHNTFTRYRHKSSAYSELPINNSSMFLSNGTCIYAPLINRVEGFALVLLCSSRSMTRKLACHILKEIRSLAHCFGYGKADDTLCLDVLDKLCPEVTEEITNNQKGLSFGAPGREYVLSIATKQDLAALVECSSNWHEHDGLHPWILFMSAFLDPSRLVALCAKALSFAWGDVYIRLSQIQQHTDSAMTSSNKKVIPAPGSSDHSLMLWTNYLVFACKCAPSSTSIKQKQQKESAIPAGTPDWRVALTRDSERLTALPSMLFQRLITQLRADGSVAHREAAVIGLGSTSVASFRDLMTELLTVIHEACECKKQENIRRKRKRDGVRAVLAKVFARLATHKVLSKGILADSEKLSGSSVKPCKQIIEDYIDEMRLLLEAADRSDSSGSALNPITASQQPPQIGLLSSQNSMIAASSSTLIDLRIHFAEMITQLIKHLPLNKRSKFLSPETRKSLFLLFSGWCNKFSSGKNLHLTDFDDLNSDTHTLMYITALRAECAVLCCGPVFEKSAISSTNGYLFTWLEALLDCPNSHVYSIGREAVVLLLHFNPAVPDLLSWLIDKCYTGTPLVSTGCFLGISTQFANSEYNCDCISMLFLTLYKIGYHEHMISETAEHLLVILLSRHFSTADVNENLTETMKRNSSTYKNPRKILGSYSKFGGHSAPLYSLSQVKLSEELARSHPEFTMSFLAELFIRFPTASDVGQRQMLQFILPWLQNVELIPLASSSNISSSDDHRQAHDLSSSVRNSGSQSHPWLPNEGWGSEEATLNVLNNLMYITTCYHMKLNAEIEKCWVTLCDTWPKNLSSCLEFLLALLSVHSSEELMKSTRLVISYLARAKSSKVIKFLIKECQIAEPVWTVCESSPKAPFYKIVSANSGSCNETCYSDTSTTTSPTTAKRASSAHNIGAMSKRENLRMSSVSAPGTQSDRYQHNLIALHANFTCFSSEMPVVLSTTSSSVKNHVQSSLSPRIKSNQSSFPVPGQSSFPKYISSTQQRTSLTPATRKQPHHLSLQQLHATRETDDDFSISGKSSTISNSTSSPLRLLRSKNNSRKRTSSNISSMPSILSTSMFALTVTNENKFSDDSTAKVTLSPNRNKFRYSHHEPLSSPSSKLNPKYASSKDLRSSFCSPNEKNEFVRPNKLNSQEKRGSAMISEDLEKRVDSLDQVKIFIKWRAFVEENMQSQPLPMPSGEILLPLSPNYISENGIDDVVGILRSNVACMLLSELVLQHGINIDWKAHLPVVFLSLVLNLDQVQVPEVPIHCQRLLANIIMKLCPHVNPTQVGRSVISSSVDSAGHSLVSQPLSSLIQDPSVMSSEAATPLSIGQISFPVDSGISSPSSTSSLKGSVTHSATDPLSSSSGQHSPIGQISEQHSSSEDSVNALVHCLIISKAQPWDHEDVTSKNTSIKSADKLITFVQKTVKILETELPSFNLKERLGYEALRFVISLPSKHHANRALQIFRALKLPLPPALLSDLVQCMVLCISEGNDAESQGHMIELLSTFLHACDTPPSPEKDKEDIRQQRSRSFTPDLSWRLSVGASEPSPTSTPTISTAHVVKNAPALAVLPNLTKPITAEEVSQHPTSPVTSPNSPSGEGLPRNSTAAPGRMGHAHKRSGSVTLTQKMIHEASQSPPTSRTNRNSYPTSPPSSRSSVRPLSCSPPLPKSPPVGLPQHSVSDKESDNPVKSPVTLRKESGEVCQPRILHSSPIPTAIHKTQSADTICSHQKTIRVSDTSGHGGSAQPVNSTEEWKNMLAQMLWIGVALLESDYEHEFLLAVQLIERVLHHLPLQCKEGRFRIERYLCQIKWNKFCGIQHLLLKGLTSAITLEASFRLLSSLITVSNLSLVSGDQEEGGGFSMMVIALLPHLINNFGEPDQACCECAQNITQVCVDDYKDKKKLQSLAHVMSLYSNRTYGKQCLTWVNVVCKYIHETFPYTIRQQLTFLVDLLEKGPASCHQPCLQIIHSLLSFSDILLTKSSPGDVKLGQDVLRSVSKYISNVKHWKEALNVLKLAVSRCSEITSPSNVGFVSSSSLSGDIDRIELPGRTLAFEFDVTGTPVIGKSTDAGTQHAKRGPAASLSHHMSMTSPPTMGWKRPHLSQRRTHEKLLPVLSICGQHLPTQSDITLTLQANRSHLPDGFSPTSPQSDNDSLNEDAFEQDDDEQSENCEDEEDKGGVDDICVLRNFDFLDELEDNEDGFALIQNQTSSKDAEVGTTEDDPDTYNLTPHHDTSQDLDQSTIIEEEDEEIENETAVPEKYLESDDSSISTGSSVISINGNNGNMADDDDGDELSSIARKNGNMTASGRRNTLEKRHSVATTSETTKSLKHIGPSSSTESFGINSCQLPRAQSHNTVVSAGLYQSTISPIPSEMLKSHSQRITRSTAKNRFTSSQQSCDTSDSEVDRSPLKSSSNDLSEDVEDPLVGNHADFRKIYTDIPHTLPPPLSDISSEPVDIPIVAPPPVDDLISATSPTHSEPATYSRIASSAPLRHVVSDWFPNSTPRSRDKNNSSALRSASVHSTLSTSHTAFTAQKKDKSTPLPGSHCTLPDLLTTRPPWKAPSPLPPDLESRWQRFIDSVATQNASSTVGNTFDLFPLLFQVLCVDFSQLSKEGCRHLGSQLSNIAGHFSSMVEQLPSQIQCPLCLTSKGAINPVFEQLKFGVLELQEHLESYNTKKKNTLQCLEMVKELQMRRRFPEYADHKSSSHEDQETLGQKRSQSADSIGLPSASYSYAFTTEPVCTYPALLKCQLELCRLLYKLHFQLLLLLKSFNKLIQLVTGSLPENKNITDEISPLHKKLLSAEAEFREQYKQNKDAEQDILAEIKSMTQDEAENTLVLDVAEGRFKFAISQLLVLRDIWPPEIFGVKEDPVTDYLTKVYFKHLQSKNEADCCYAVLGRDDVARGMCERLMEVNSQIQQSLQSLSVIAPASDAGSTSSDKKSKTTRRTLL